MKFVARTVYYSGCVVGAVGAIFSTVWACVKCVYKRSWQPLDDLVAQATPVENDNFEKLYSAIFQK